MSIECICLKISTLICVVVQALSALIIVIQRINKIIITIDGTYIAVFPVSLKALSALTSNYYPDRPNYILKPFQLPGKYTVQAAYKDA